MRRRRMFKLKRNKISSNNTNNTWLTRKSFPFCFHYKHFRQNISFRQTYWMNVCMGYMKTASCSLGSIYLFNRQIYYRIHHSRNPPFHPINSSFPTLRITYTSIVYTPVERKFYTFHVGKARSTSPRN